MDQLSFCFLRPTTAAFWGLPFLLGGAFLGPGRRRTPGSPEDSLKGTRGHEIEFKIFDKGSVAKPDPNPLVRGTDPAPDPSIIKQK